MSVSKIIKRGLIILLILIIGIGIFAYFSAQKLVNTYVKETLIEDYNSNPELNYIVTFDKIKLDLLQGGITLLDINVQPKDSLITLVSNLNQKLSTNTYVNVNIKEISIFGFDYSRFANERQIAAKKFEILSPKVAIYNFEGLPEPEENNQDTVDLRSIFLANFDTFHIDLVHVDQISMSYNKVSKIGDTTQVISIENLSYSLNHVVANNSTLFSETYFDYSGFTLNSKKITSQIGNTAKVEIEAIKYSSDDEQLFFKDFSFEPLVTPATFFKHKKYRKAWIKFSTSEITINQLSIDHWLANNEIQLQKIIVDEPVLTVFTNSNLPFEPGTKKELLGQIITQIDVPFIAHFVKVKNGQIVVDMLGKQTENRAQLKLNALDISASNLTNIPTVIAENNILDIHASTNPMGAGKVNADIKINLADIKSTTRFNVNATNLNLTKFNSVTAPLIRISVRDGSMVNLDITSTINTDGATGKMDAHYENLMLQMENKEMNESPKFLENTISSIANGYLKNNNIPLQKNYRTGKIDFAKTPNDSFFKMLWLVVLTGMEDSVLGSDKRDAKQIKRAAKKQNNKIKLNLTKGLFKSKK